MMPTRPIWTWCPRCTVRTDHLPVIRGWLRCLACGSIHAAPPVFRPPMKRSDPHAKNTEH